MTFIANLRLKFLAIIVDQFTPSISFNLIYFYPGGYGMDDAPVHFPTISLPYQITVIDPGSIGYP